MEIVLKYGKQITSALLFDFGYFEFVVVLGKGYKMMFILLDMENNLNNVVTKEKLDRYFSITGEAFSIVKESVVEGKDVEAREIFEMVENYVSDAKHFMERGDYVLAFAALNYAHGWIDAGVRLDVFDVSDDRLFTVK